MGDSQSVLPERAHDIRQLLVHIREQEQELERLVLPRYQHPETAPGLSRWSACTGFWELTGSQLSACTSSLAVIRSQGSAVILTNSHPKQ